MSEEMKKEEENKSCGGCEKQCGGAGKEEVVCESTQNTETAENEKNSCCGKKQADGTCEKHEECADAEMKNEKGEKCEKKKKLFAEIDELKKEAEENKRKWYAVTAEYENYRRRTEKQSATRYAEGRNDVVAALFYRIIKRHRIACITNIRFIISSKLFIC